MSEHEHTPRVVTRHDARAKMREKGGLNTRIAVYLTRIVSTMPTAYAFAVLAVVGLLAILGVFPPIVALLVVWFSQTFLQLCFLPILAVGTSVLGQHQELLSEEQYRTTNKTYHDIEKVMKHLDEQDKTILDMAGKIEQVEKIETSEVLKQSDMLEAIMTKLDAHDAMLKMLTTPKPRRSVTHD